MASEVDHEITRTEVRDETQLSRPTREQAELQARNWVWRSTIESAEAGKVSVLAITETIAATAVYAWIAWRFGTLHLAVSTCVAPFLLLRTPRSASMALTYYPYIYRWSIDRLLASVVVVAGLLCIVIICLWVQFTREKPEVHLLVILLVVFSAALHAMPTMMFRFVLTAFCVVTRPMESISGLPWNWWKSLSAIDSFYPLEMLHGAHLKYDLATLTRVIHPFQVDSAYANLLPWTGLRALLRNRWTRSISPLGICRFMVAAPGLFITALCYRWSLKGSVLIYSPLIWIAHSAMARSLRDHLRDIHELALHRIARTFAAFVLLLFLAKIYLYYAWSDLASSWHAIPGHRLLDAVVMPKALPWWQIASATNATLAWVLYLVADWVVVRWNRGSSVNEPAVELALRWLSLLRGVLSIYTIACCIYLAASLVEQFGLPPLGARIVPWW